MILRSIIWYRNSLTANYEVKFHELFQQYWHNNRTLSNELKNTLKVLQQPNVKIGELPNISNVSLFSRSRTNVQIHAVLVEMLKYYWILTKTFHLSFWYFLFISRWFYSSTVSIIQFHFIWCKKLCRTYWCVCIYIFYCCFHSSDCFFPQPKICLMCRAFSYSMLTYYRNESNSNLNEYLLELCTHLTEVADHECHGLIDIYAVSCCYYYSIC